MAVYVDRDQMKFGRMIMCHMLADTTAELFQMADIIGVQRKWLQHAGTEKEHFDICISKRVKALAAGAIEVHREKLVEIISTKRSTLKREEATSDGTKVNHRENHEPNDRATTHSNRASASN